MTETPGEIVRHWVAVGDDRVAYPGFTRIVHRTLRLPDGREVQWDLLDVPPTVTVLPFTPDGSVVLVRQFRPGPNGLVLSPPGGFVEPGEEVLDAAARELREETGYVSGSIHRVASMRPNNATQPRHVAVAIDCVARHDQDLDEFEDIETVVLSLTDLRSELRAGRLGAPAQTYLALDSLHLL
jgi:ADP-ribose pyrophosphatase